MSGHRFVQNTKPADSDLLQLIEPAKLRCASEFVFEVREDEVSGGYTAKTTTYSIHTQGDTLEELRTMVRDAVDCYFDECSSSRRTIRLRFAGRSPGLIRN